MTAALTSFVEPGIPAAGTSTLPSTPLEAPADASVPALPFSELVDQALGAGDPQPAVTPEGKDARGDVSHSLLPNSRRPLPAPVIVELAELATSPAPTEPGADAAAPSGPESGAPTCDVIVETDASTTGEPVPTPTLATPPSGRPGEAPTSRGHGPTARPAGSLVQPTPNSGSSPNEEAPSGGLSGDSTGESIDGTAELAFPGTGDDGDSVEGAADGRRSKASPAQAVAPAATDPAIAAPGPVAVPVPVSPVPVTPRGESLPRSRVDSGAGASAGNPGGVVGERVPAVSTVTEGSTAPGANRAGGEVPISQAAGESATGSAGQRPTAKSNPVLGGTTHRPTAAPAVAKAPKVSGMAESRVASVGSTADPAGTAASVEPLIVAAMESASGEGEETPVPTTDSDVIVPTADRSLREEVSKTVPEARREVSSKERSAVVDRPVTIPTARAATVPGETLVSVASRNPAIQGSRVAVEPATGATQPTAVADPSRSTISAAQPMTTASSVESGKSTVRSARDFQGTAEPLRIAQAGFLRFQTEPVAVTSAPAKTSEGSPLEAGGQVGSVPTKTVESRAAVSNGSQRESRPMPAGESRTLDAGARGVPSSPRGAMAIPGFDRSVAEANPVMAPRAAETTANSDRPVVLEVQPEGSVNPRIQEWKSFDSAGSSAAGGAVSSSTEDAPISVEPVPSRNAEEPVTAAEIVTRRPEARGETSVSSPSRSPLNATEGGALPRQAVPAGVNAERAGAKSGTVDEAQADPEVDPNATMNPEPGASEAGVDGNPMTMAGPPDGVTPVLGDSRAEVRKDGKAAMAQSISEDAKRASGTPGAEMGNGMKKGRKPSKAAEETLHILPIDREGLAGVSLPTLSSRETSTRRSSESHRVSDADEARVASSVHANPRWEPGQDVEVVSEIRVKDHSSRVSQIESFIAREAGVVRKTGAQSLSVVLRPDTKTELLVQLNQTANGVEASIRCERGEFPAARSEWNQLRDALAAQNIRLAPPPEVVAAAVAADTSTGHGSRSPWAEDRFSRGQQQQQQQPAPQQQSQQNNQQQHASSHRRQEPGYETRPRPDSGVGVAAKTGSTPQRPVRRGGWESWA